MAEKFDLITSSVTGFRISSYSIYVYFMHNALIIAFVSIQIVKQLWVYIRKHNLQDPENKRRIICDDALRLVFETDCTDMFKMNKLLAKHILTLDPSSMLVELGDHPFFFFFFFLQILLMNIYSSQYSLTACRTTSSSQESKS